MSVGDRGGVCKLLVFKAEESVCAFPVAAICEISHIPALTRVPGQPSIIEGFLDFHQRPVAVISLAKLLRIPNHEPGLFAVVILTRVVDDILGVLVDSVEGVRTVAATDIKPLPPNHSFKDCSVGQFTLDDYTATLLACDRILIDAERKSIADLADQASERLHDVNPLESQEV